MHSRHCAAALASLGLAATSACPAAPERPESQQEYWAQVDERDWSAAVAAAETLVAAARRNAAQQPLALAEALSLLGDAQLGAANYVGAEAAFSEALRLVEGHGSAMSADLFEPLRGLGYTFAASGRHDRAAPLLDTALIVAHRNYGLFDVGQRDLLRQLAATLTLLGRTEEAERRMNYLLRVAEQQYGRDDPRISPTLCVVGEWYTDVANFAAARETFRRAIEIVDNKLGRKSMAAVEPLRGLARTYTQELHASTLGIRTRRSRVPTDADGSSNEHEPLNPRYLSSEGEEALQRAVKIIEAQAAAPRDVHVVTLVQLGDWRQIKDQPEDALPLYRRAAKLGAQRPDQTDRPTQTDGAQMGKAQMDDAQMERTQTDGSGAEKDRKSALLGFPVRVYYPTPWLAARNRTLPAQEVDETFVEVEFTVTRDGSVRDAHVVDRNGTERQADESLEAIREARFRPRFVNGEPVDTAGVTHREVFRTRKSSDDEDS